MQVNPCALQSEKRRRTREKKDHEPNNIMKNRFTDSCLLCLFDALQFMADQIIISCVVDARRMLVTVCVIYLFHVVCR